MTTADEVRAVALSLPRSREEFIGGRWKFKVKQYVFCAFSRDEQSIGFGFPREERAALVDSDPDTFFMPPAGDLRYQWVCARLDPLVATLMAELVVDGWRMCVPAMLHDLPELPAPAAQAWSALDASDFATARALLHPQIMVTNGSEIIRGRAAVLACVRDRGPLKPPRAVEVRNEQVYRWTR